MDPGAIVVVSFVIVGAIVSLVVLAGMGDQKPSTTTKSTKRSERYDRIWTELEGQSGKALKNLNVLAASRGGGKSYMAAYQQGYQKGHQNGYQEGALTLSSSTYQMSKTIHCSSLIMNSTSYTQLKVLTRQLQMTDHDSKA